MAPKFIEKILVALHLKQRKCEKYDYDAHMHLEAQGFYNEGLEGTYKCPTKNCKNTVAVYRQVRRQGTDFHDVLRFEQNIPVHPSSAAKSKSSTKTKNEKSHPYGTNNNITLTSPGKVSVTHPVIWNGENGKAVNEKEYIGTSKKADGKSYVLVKQRYFAGVTCVKCSRDIHLWDE